MASRVQQMNQAAEDYALAARRARNGLERPPGQYLPLLDDLKEKEAALRKAARRAYAPDPHEDYGED